MNVRSERNSHVGLGTRSSPPPSSIERNPNLQRSPRAAFSLAETLISVILVGGLMVTALNTVGASLTTRENMIDRGVGQLLAQDLMSEIGQQTYLEPLDVPVFGREAGELATSRNLYDDIDDYNTWTASPPQNKDGTAIAGMAGWRRAVEVDWVDTTNVNVWSAVETDAKRITVSVFDNTGVQVANLCSVRTNSSATTSPPTKTAVDPTPLPPPVLVQ